MKQSAAITQLICILICIVSIKFPVYGQESFDSVLKSIWKSSPDSKALSTLLQAFDASTRTKKPNSKTTAKSINEIRPATIKLGFELLQPAYKPGRDLGQIKSDLSETLKKPCTNYIRSVLGRAASDSTQSQLDFSCKIGKDWCRAFQLCRVIKNAFDLDKDLIVQSARLISPRSQGESEVDYHPGLMNKLEQISGIFEQLVGSANIALLVKGLQLDQQTSGKGYRSLKLSSTNDIKSSVLEETYEKVYKRSQLIINHQYLVQPFLRYALYEPCENYLNLIGNDISACHLDKHSNLACTGAIVCQLIRTSYREKRSNWTAAEQKLRSRAANRTPAGNEISYALSKNQADNYETLKLKLANFEREMFRYKYV